jgi:hypothetical protein
MHGKIYSFAIGGSHFYALSKIDYQNTTILSKIDILGEEITRVTANPEDFEEHLTGCRFTNHATHHSSYIAIVCYRRITHSVPEK